MTRDKARSAKAVDGLIETAQFAASILKELDEGGFMPRGSLAGKALEARTRLEAAVKFVEDTDERIIEQRTKTRVLKALGLGEEVWKAGSMHAHRATCFIELEAETIPDALLIAERMSPIQACNTEQYKGTILPMETLPEKKGPPFELMPYWGELSGFGRQQVFQLRFYVKAGDDIVNVRVNVKDFSPIYARCYEERDGHGRVVNKRWDCVGYNTYFKNLRRMWASPGTMNDFIMY